MGVSDDVANLAGPGNGSPTWMQHHRLLKGKGLSSYCFPLQAQRQLTGSNGDTTYTSYQHANTTPALLDSVLLAVAPVCRFGAKAVLVRTSERWHEEVIAISPLAHLNPTRRQELLGARARAFDQCFASVLGTCEAEPASSQIISD